jgi:hypothetical protein
MKSQYAILQPNGKAGHPNKQAPQERVVVLCAYNKQFRLASPQAALIRHRNLAFSLARILPRLPIAID